MDIKNTIAKRVAKELKSGDVVNLGIGLPTWVANHVPSDVHVIFQSENGILGLGSAPPADAIDPDIFDAGCANATILPGAWFFDSATSFGLIRGGHVDVTVLGALQVDQEGNLANWMVPGKMIAGYGGAMDLVTCAKKVILAMEHTVKGNPKIFNKCTFPLTGTKCVDLIVTEMAVIEVTKEGLVLREIAEGVSLQQIKDATEADLIIPENINTMPVVNFS